MKSSHKKNQKKAQKAKQRKEQIKRAKIAEQKKKTFVRDISVEVRADFALQKYEEGDIKEAKKDLQALLRQEPNDAYVQYVVGTIEAQEDNLDEAQRHLEMAIRKKPDYIDAHFNLAMVYRLQISLSPMIRSLQRVIEFGEEKDELVLQARQDLEAFAKSCAVPLKDFCRAEDFYRKALQEMDNEFYTEAIPLFQQAIELNSAPPQPFGNMGVCYAKLGKIKLALQALDQALELEPDYPAALRNRPLIASLNEGEKLEIGVEIVSYR